MSWCQGIRHDIQFLMTNVIQLEHMYLRSLMAMLCRMYVTYPEILTKNGDRSSENLRWEFYKEQEGENV
jgi:hypothetical protein